MDSEVAAASARDTTSALKDRLRRDTTTNNALPDPSLPPTEAEVVQPENTQRAPGLRTVILREGRPFSIELENERTHAGDVARRSNNAVRALPPPEIATKPGMRSETTADQSRRKQSRNDRDDSDDDSEDDKRKPRRDEKKMGGMQRKKPATDMPNISASSLTAEEKERVRLMRTLRAAEEKWKIFELEQKINMARKREKEQILVAKNLHHQLDASGEIRRDVITNNVHLQQFLDDILFRYIRDQSDRVEHQLQKSGESEAEKDISQSHSYLEEVILHIEDGVIARSRDFDEWAQRPIMKWDDMPPSKVERICSILRRMQATLWSEIQDLAILENKAEATIRSYVSQRLSSRGPGDTFSLRQSQFAQTDALLEQYFKLLSAGLAQSIAQDIKAGLSGPENLELLNTFKTSRIEGNERLSQDYISWVTQGLDDRSLRDRCESWFRSVRDETLCHFRGVYHGVIDQKFIDSAEDPTNVSVVLFKARVATSVLQVSPETLSKLGWRRDDNKGRYWRYCLGYSSKNHLLKVQMNEDVVGIWTPHGDCDWSDSFLDD